MGWKQRCLNKQQDKNTFRVWSRDAAGRFFFETGTGTGTDLNRSDRTRQADRPVRVIGDFSHLI